MKYTDTCKTIIKFSGVIQIVKNFIVVTKGWCVDIRYKMFVQVLKYNYK